MLVAHAVPEVGGAENHVVKVAQARHSAAERTHLLYYFAVELDHKYSAALAAMLLSSTLHFITVAVASDDFSSAWAACAIESQFERFKGQSAQSLYKMINVDATFDHERRGRPLI